jgi:hypothetical protein
MLTPVDLSHPVVRIRICVTAMLVKPLAIVKRELQAAGGDRRSCHAASIASATFFGSSDETTYRQSAKATPKHRTAKKPDHSVNLSAGSCAAIEYMAS